LSGPSEYVGLEGVVCPCLSESDQTKVSHLLLLLLSRPRTRRQTLRSKEFQAVPAILPQNFQIHGSEKLKSKMLLKRIFGLATNHVAQRGIYWRGISNLEREPSSLLATLHTLQKTACVPRCATQGSFDLLRLALFTPRVIRSTCKLPCVQATQDVPAHARLLVMPARKPPGGWDGANGGEYHSGAGSHTQYRFRQYQGWEGGPTPSKFSILIRETPCIPACLDMNQRFA
jgi:hypothetical protein